MEQLEPIAARPVAGLTWIEAKQIGQQTSWQVHFSNGGHGSANVETERDEIARILCGRTPFGFAVCVLVYAAVVALA